MSRNYSKGYGEKGKCRVRVWEPRPGSNLMIAVWEGGKLVMPRSLGHRDRELGEQQAYDLISQLNKAKSEDERERITSGGKVTLGALVRTYAESATFAALSKKHRRAKRARLDLLARFFGPGRDVMTLDAEDIQHLQHSRIKGLNGLAKAGQQTVYAEFSALRSVLRWACSTKDANGRKILREYPIFGVSVEQNKRPRQVLITHEGFLKLRRAARRLKPHYWVFLLMVEGTGRRMSSVLNLEWSDLDLEAGTVLWQGEKDKMDTETHLLLPPHLIRVLRFWRSHNPETRYVFEKQDGRRGFREGFALAQPQPYTDNAGFKWMDAIWKEAGMKKPKGAGWHSLRRKWVTERKDLPDADVMAAGGWRSVSAFKRYQKPDLEATRRVVERPSRRLVGSGEPATITYNTARSDDIRTS